MAFTELVADRRSFELRECAIRQEFPYSKLASVIFSSYLYAADMRIARREVTQP